MKWNLLIISDLHLGEQEAGETRETVQQRTDIITRHVSSFLDYYREHRVNGRPWRLLIAGDMIDFIRVHVMMSNAAPKQSGMVRAGLFDQVNQPSQSDLTLRMSKTISEDLDQVKGEAQESSEGEMYSWEIPAHDLDGTLCKLAWVFRIHHEIFLHLAHFICAGHQLAILTGNHDAELDWQEIQAAFRQHLYEIACHEHPDISRTSFARRIMFFPHYYYEPGRLYAEHGHYYDAYCRIEKDFNLSKTGHKVSPYIPKAHTISFAHALSGWQYSNPQGFESLPIHNVDQWGFFDIMRWVLKRPLRQIIILLFQYLILTLHLTWLAWKRNTREALTTPGEEGREAVRKIATAHELPPEALEELQRFVTSPVHAKVFDTIQAFYFDRVLLVIATAFLISLALVAPWDPMLRAGIATATSAMFVAALQYLALRRPVAETIPTLLDTAFKIATYLKTPLIVFGHSHHYEQRTLRDGQLYINLGAWAVPNELLNLTDIDRAAIESGEYVLPLYQTPYLILTNTYNNQITVGYWRSD